MRRALWIAVAAACSHAAPPPVAKAADPEIPPRTVADIAGQWVSTENLDWHMNIDASGTIDLWIDLEKKRCEQKGTITAGKTVGQFQLLYTLGGCDPKAVNVPLDATISSFTGSHLTIVVGERHQSYERASGRTDDDSDRPASLQNH